MCSGARKLTDNNFVYVFVPANMTGWFQPLDVSINKRVKNCVRNSYNDLICIQMQVALSGDIALTDKTTNFNYKTITCGVAYKYVLQFTVFGKA